MKHRNLRLPAFHACTFLLRKNGISESADLLLHTIQADELVEFAETFFHVDYPRLLVGYIGFSDAHHLFAWNVIEIKFLLQTVALTRHSFLKQGYDTAGIAEIFILRSHHSADSLAEEFHCIIVDPHFLAVHLLQVYFFQFGSGIIDNMNPVGEPTGQPRVGIRYKFVNQILISGDYCDELSCVADHTCHKTLDGSLTVLTLIVGVVHRDKIICLINEKNASQRLIHGVVHVFCRRVGIAVKEVLFFFHHDLVCRQDARSLKHLTEAFGNLGLAGAGVAGNGDMDTLAGRVDQATLHSLTLYYGFAYNRAYILL